LLEEGDWDQGEDDYGMVWDWNMKDMRVGGCGEGVGVKGKL
jgi:hypothetical protein